MYIRAVKIECLHKCDVHGDTEFRLHKPSQSVLVGGGTLPLQAPVYIAPLALLLLCNRVYLHHAKSVTTKIVPEAGVISAF
jgi:hypothetical protein